MRVYRLLLLAYPESFRQRYGPDMRQAFLDRRRDAARRGRLSLIGFWFATLTDVLTNAFAERRANRMRGLAPASRGRWSIGRDLGLAVRSLYRQPGLAATVLVTLGLGIGANTAIFSWVRGVVLQPLGFPESQRLVQVWQGGPGRYMATPAAGAIWETRTDLFTGAAVYLYTSANLTDREPAERIPVARVSGSFFDVLGVTPLLGRTLQPSDAVDGAPGVAVMSYDTWQQRFDGAGDILQRTVRLGETTFSVVGVMPAGFEDLSWRGADLWTPLVLDPANRRSSYRAIARLRPDVEIGQAGSALRVQAEDLNREFGDDEWPASVSVGPLQDAIVGDVGTLAVAAQVAALLVLLIACANLANLLLARSAGRRQEFAIRGALGARRGQLVRQLLAESLVLSLAGGLAGVVVAMWGIKAIVAAAPVDMPRLDQIQVDTAVLLAGLGLAAVTGIVFGLAPALRLARTGVDTHLWAGQRSVTGGAQRPIRWLIVGEVAIAVILLAASGVAGRKLLAMRGVDVGLRTTDVVGAEVSLPTSVYQTTDAQRDMFDRMVERLAVVPGVEAAGFVDTIPLSQSWSIGRYRLEEGSQDAFMAMAYRATADYFRVVDIPLLQGRTFEARDADGPAVVLASRAFVRRHWPDGDAIGRRIWYDLGESSIPLEIVGVVGDVHHTGLDDAPEPSVYFAFAQVPTSRGVLVARAAGDPHQLIGPIRRAMAELDPSLPLFNTRTIADLRGEALAAPELVVTLIGSTGLLALALGVVGVYGIVAFSVATRRRETGVRLALGATPDDVTRMFLVHGLKLTGLGLLIGVCAAGGLGYLARNVAAVDPASGAGTLAAAALLLTLAAAAACYLPARRVLRVDPGDVMKS